MLNDSVRCVCLCLLTPLNITQLPFQASDVPLCKVVRFWSTNAIIADNTGGSYTASD